MTLATIDAADDRHVLGGAGAEPEAVHETDLRGRRKRGQRTTQACEIRAVQALAVDLTGRDDLNRDFRRGIEHRAEELLAVLGADLLRVVQLRERANAVIPKRPVVEQDARDDERPRE